MQPEELKKSLKKAKVPGGENPKNFLIWGTTVPGKGGTLVQGARHFEENLFKNGNPKARIKAGV